jgi:peptide/nickel transport system substrate-binding protein
MIRTTTCRTGASAVALLLAFSGPAAAQDGQTLNVGIVSDPVTLDPALMASFFELSVQYNLHEPLVHVTPDLEIEPGLATVEQVDGTTYEFELRPDLTFHDGTAIDAEAVKANFDRMLEPETGSPRRSELGPIAGMEVTGNLTFTIRMEEPYAPFLQVLSNRAGMMVSPAALEDLGDDFASQAVGAGPYRLVSWDRNSELVLEAFEDYWRGAPEIERVIFRPMSDETVRVTNLRSGTVQLVDAVPPQMLEQLRAEGNIEVMEQPGLGFNAFSFNTTVPPFDDAAVRRAFVAAVDPNSVLQAVFFNTGQVAHGPIPPSLGWAHDPDFSPWEGGAEEARSILDEAGQGTPIQLTITVTNAPSAVRTAEVIQAQVNQVGFDASIRQIDAASLITILRERDFDISMSPWSGRSDPDGNMFNYFTIGGPNNFAGWESEEVDALLRDARAETDQDARRDLYRAAEEAIAEDAPMLFLTFPATIQASSTSLDWLQYPDGAFRLQFARFQ